MIPTIFQAHDNRGVMVTAAEVAAILFVEEEVVLCSLQTNSRLKQCDVISALVQIKKRCNDSGVIR